MGNRGRRRPGRQKPREPRGSEPREDGQRLDPQPSATDYGPAGYAEGPQPGEYRGQYGADLPSLGEPPYAGGPYAPGPYVGDPYVPDPYARGPYAVDPYGTGSLGTAGDVVAYGSTAYGTDQSPPDPYLTGPYPPARGPTTPPNAAGYPSNPYPSNPYPSNPYPSNPYPSNPYPSNPHPTNSYSTEPYPGHLGPEGQHYPARYPSDQYGMGRMPAMPAPYPTEYAAGPYSPPFEQPATGGSPQPVREEPRRGIAAPEERPTGGRAQRRRAAKRARRRRRLRATREVPLLVSTALLIALLLKTFLLQAFSIPSGSMENTIRVDDRVVVDKLTPWFGSTPSRGDVVVFKDPGGWLKGQPPPKPDPPGIKQLKSFFTFIGLLPSPSEQDLIKRVVAVGGDTVACCDKGGRVTVNGHPLNETYLRPGGPPSKVRFEVRVPRGRFFVMGDNRSNSADSREHLGEPYKGTVPEDLVVGRAFVIAWPTSHWRGLEEPETFAAVPSRAGATTASETANNPLGTYAPPIPVELPIVMSVVGILPSRVAVRLGRARSRARDGRRSREE